MATKIFNARRVIYGSPKTPVAKREYKLVMFGINSPVGTKKEWNTWAKKNKVKIIFDDKRNMKGEHI